MNNDYSVKEVLEEFRKETEKSLSRIEIQTVKTNSRVNHLENHRSYLWGAYTVLVLLGGTICYFIVGAIDTKIQNGINNALASYNIQYVQK